MLEDPKLWVAASFVVFFALTWRKIAAFATRALDERSAKIAAELNQAKTLREEAEQVLADYRRRQSESLKEAESILAKARTDADSYRRQAETELKGAMEARLRQAMEKIEQEEAKAVQEVRDHVVDIALSAARALISDQVAAMPRDELVKLALSDIQKKIH